MEGISVKPNFTTNRRVAEAESCLGSKHCIRKCICITRANGTHDNEIVLENYERGLNSPAERERDEHELEWK